MSIGAAAFAVAGAAAGAVRRACASAVATNAVLATTQRPQATNNRSTRIMSISVDSERGRGASIERLATLAPTEAVRRPQQRAHANAVIDRVTARVARDDDLVAGLQRFARHALASQRTRAAPLDAPA